MTIENTFGRLKGRWRKLHKRLVVNVGFACSVVAACVVLHNDCEMRQELYEYQRAVETNDEEDDIVEHGDLDMQEVMCAHRIRDDVHNIQ